MDPRRACTCSSCSACECWGAGCRRFLSCLSPAGWCSSRLQSPSSIHHQAAVSTRLNAAHGSPSHPPCAPQVPAAAPPVSASSPPGSTPAGALPVPATSIPSSSTQEHVVPAPGSAVDQPEAQEEQIPEFTIVQLEKLIGVIKEEIDRLDPDRANSSSQVPISQRLGDMVEKYEKNKQICTSFVETLPKELKKEIVGNGRNVVMPLLSQALGGVGAAHWLGVGVTFIAWSLSNINGTIENRKDCLEIVRRSLLILENTKKIWKATDLSDMGDGNLLNSIEIAVRCALFCTSSLSEVWILSALKASTMKDAIATMKQELDRAVLSNVEYMSMANMQSNIERQITFTKSSDDIVGQGEVFKEALTFLKAADKDLRAILLYGMGGIGKSTQAMRIFNDFHQQRLYRACRVELPFDTRTGHFEMREIQKQIIEKVCRSAAPGISNVTDGKEHLKKALEQISGYPVFLYVDNVQIPRDLSELLPMASCFPRGSKLLVTSRVSRTDGFFELGIPADSYKATEVRKLPAKEAQGLFWKKLGSVAGTHRSDGEIASLEDRVLAQCDGLPLALKVVGGYLGASPYYDSRKKVEIWSDVVESMEKAEYLEGSGLDEIHSRLQFSTQKVNEVVKQVFLDVVFALKIGGYKHDEIDRLGRLVGGQKYINELCQRSLVRKNEDRGTVEMHDVLSALGRRTLEDDQEDLRIAHDYNQWENLLYIKYVPDERISKVVALKNVTVEASHLLQMRRLRLLIDVEVVGECKGVILRELKMADGLSCASAGVLDWSQCTSLSHIGWGSPPFEFSPPDVSNLKVLEHKNIARRLEVLKLPNWRGLKDVQVLETLTCLKVLELNGCRRIESLPEGISMLRGLEELQLRKCAELRALPDGLVGLTNLRRLLLLYCASLQSIPEGIGNLTGLTELDMQGCESLQSIPEGIGNLTGLTELELQGCVSLQTIPEGIGNSTGLIGLHLQGCASLQTIPEGIGNLTGLTRLNLSFCASLQSIPEGIGNSTGLTWLDLSYCASLQSIPKGIGSLTGLTSLVLSNCASLQSIPDSIGNLTGLRHLFLDNCTSLKSIPEGIGKLTGVTELDVQGCTSLQSIPEDIGKLTGLRYLKLSACTSLKSIPEGIGKLTGLTKLDLQGCTSLQSIPEDIGNLLGLTELGLSNCASLECIPEGIGELTGLTRLNLLGCASLQNIPEGIGNLTGLSRLDLNGCTSLKHIPEGFRNLTGLRALQLSNL